MKKILGWGFVFATTLALTGCKDLPGVLIVTKNFNVLVKGKNTTVTAGQHKTDLDFKKNRVIAQIDTDKGTLQVELTVPNGSQIPNNGNFELRSTQSGQPFDILGQVQTKTTDSETKSGFQSCQKQDYQTVCGPNGCSVVPVIRQGSQTIEYFDRTVDQKMQFDMTVVGSAKDKYATFNGEANSTQQMITYSGPCY